MSPRQICLCAIVCCWLSGSVQVQADIVIEWNDVAGDTLVADVNSHNPGMASRTMAMLNLAIYDAMSMTKSGGSLFYDYGTGHTSPGYSASASAAAAQAAYTVLSSLYPNQQSSLNTRLSSSLSGVADGAEKSAGISMGSMVGESIVNFRANDGYNSSVQFQPSGQVGHWQPDPMNPGQQGWGPEWGRVVPFALQSTAQFMPVPPPALTSQQYADSFNEVKSLGAINSTTRTAEQTEIGLFWAYDRVGMGTPLALYNNVLQSIAQQQGNTPEQNAELFAKSTVAMADAGIVAWDSKYEFDLWRPVTGIRQADLDGNPLTEADPNWVPLGAPGGVGNDFTPPFPTYLSGHATFGGALFESIKEFYGTDNLAFTLTSDELLGVQRSFTTLSDAMAENGRSRVYLGIHWDFDDTIGQATGMEVARHIGGQPFISAVPEPAGAAWFSLIALSFWRKRRRSSVLAL